MTRACERGFRRAALASLALSVIVALSGCGSDSSPTVSPTPAPTPTPVTRSVILEGHFDLESFTFHRRPFTVVGPGKLDVTVDWTFPSSTIWVYVAQGQCSIEQFQQRFRADTCNFVIRSETETPKPRVLELANVPAGDFVFFVTNRSEGSESGVYNVGLTR